MGAKPCSHEGIKQQQDTNTISIKRNRKTESMKTQRAQQSKYQNSTCCGSQSYHDKYNGIIPDDPDKITLDEYRKYQNTDPPQITQQHSFSSNTKNINNTNNMNIYDRNSGDGAVDWNQLVFMAEPTIIHSMITPMFNVENNNNMSNYMDVNIEDEAETDSLDTVSYLSDEYKEEEEGESDKYDLDDMDTLELLNKNDSNKNTARRGSNLLRRNEVNNWNNNAMDELEMEMLTELRRLSGTNDIISTQITSNAVPMERNKNKWDEYIDELIANKFDIIRSDDTDDDDIDSISDLSDDQQTESEHDKYDVDDMETLQVTDNNNNIEIGRRESNLLRERSMDNWNKTDINQLKNEMLTEMRRISATNDIIKFMRTTTNILELDADDTEDDDVDSISDLSDDQESDSEHDQYDLDDMKSLQLTDNESNTRIGRRGSNLLREKDVDIWNEKDMDQLKMEMLSEMRRLSGSDNAGFMDKYDITATRKYIDGRLYDMKRLYTISSGDDNDDDIDSISDLSDDTQTDSENDRYDLDNMETLQLMNNDSNKCAERRGSNLLRETDVAHWNKTEIDQLGMEMLRELRRLSVQSQILSAEEKENYALDQNILDEIHNIVDNTWHDINNGIVSCPLDGDSYCKNNGNTSNAANYNNNNDGNEQYENYNNNDNNWNYSNGAGTGGSGKGRDDDDDDEEKRNNNKRKQDDDDDDDEDEKEEEKDKEEEEEEKEDIDTFTFNVDASDFIPDLCSLHNVCSSINSQRLLPIDESKPFPEATKSCDGSERDDHRKQPETNRFVIKYEYDPNPVFRGKYNTKIPDKLIKNTLRKRINRKYSNLYRYINKTHGLSDEYATFCDDDKTKIIAYDFFDAKTSDLLYCVMRKQCNGSKREWKLLNGVFNAKHIINEYDIDMEELPHSFRSTQQFISQINKENNIINIISNTKSMGNIIKETKWHKISIYKRPNHKQRITLSFTKETFIKSLTKHINQLNGDNIRLLDILMFDHSNKKINKYRIVYVWIVRIADNTDIGISLIYNQENGNIYINGIHLDKQYLLEQHELINRNHDCHCLDSFESNINDLMIGNPDQHQNLAKDSRKKLNEIKTENIALKKRISALEEENQSLKQKVVTQHPYNNNESDDDIKTKELAISPTSTTDSNSSTTPILAPKISVSGIQSPLINTVNIPQQQLPNFQPVTLDLLQSLVMCYQPMIDLHGNVVWVLKSN